MSEHIYKPLGLGEGSVIAEKYNVARIVGGDSLCVLLETYCPERQHSVLLRLFSPDATKPAEKMRPLLEDLSAAKGIAHENLLETLEISKTKSEELYVAYQNFRFTTLRDEFHQLSGDRYSVGETIHIFLKISQALQAAHIEEKAHLHLTPSQILLNEDGEVRLGGLGLGRLYAGELGKESDTLSLSYRAPEQLNASVGDMKSDIYSLGVIAYQMLLGVHPGPPDGGATERVNSDALKGETKVLAELIDAMLAKDPTQRSVNVSEIITKLELLWPSEEEEAQKGFQTFRAQRRSLLSKSLTEPKLSKQRLILGIGGGFAVLLSLGIFLAVSLLDKEDNHDSSHGNMLQIPQLAKKNIQSVEEAIWGEYVKRDPRSGKQTYLNTNHSFLFSFPLDWSADTSPKDKTLLATFSSPSTTRNEVSLSISFVKNTDGVSLQEYADESNAALLLELESRTPKVIEAPKPIRFGIVTMLKSSVFLESEKERRYLELYYQQQDEDFLKLQFSFSEDEAKAFQEQTRTILQSFMKMSENRETARKKQGQKRGQTPFSGIILE